MANYEATRYDYDGANLTGIEGIPTATIIPWTDSSVPSGYLECNGAAVSRSTYSALFAIIGTTYGAGDGSSTFNVPDLQDNVPVGKSGTKAVGSTGGANQVASSGNVGGNTGNATLSTSQLASHNHTIAPRNGGGLYNSSVGVGFHTLTGSNATVDNTGSGSSHSHNMSANFVGDATSVIQPYQALIYIIKT